MQHVLQISRKIDYGLRAMIHLAGLPAGKIASLQDLSVTLHLPREFLAKILKILTAKGLVRSSRRPCSRGIKRVIKRPAGPDPARAPVRASAPPRAPPAATPSDIRCARPTATASRRPRRAARTRAPRMALSSAGTGARIEDPPLR